MVNRADATYYKIFFNKNGEASITEKTFYSNNTLRSVIHFESKNRLKKMDTSKAFYANGKLHWFKAYNKINEAVILKQFHLNGQLKRIEWYRDNQFYKGKKYNNSGKRVRFSQFNQAAKYSGGPARMIAYLNRTIKYPKTALENNIVGTVYVGFIVTTKGDIINTEIIKSDHPVLNAEAIRVVKIMKQWIPGKINDKPVNSRISIPITFGKPEAEEHIPYKN